MSNEHARPKSSKRIAILLLVGVVLACLCMLWNGSNGPFAHDPIADPADTISPDSQPPSPQEVKARAIAIAEVKRREGWSGKVIVAPQEATTFYVFVERGANEDPGIRHIREVDVDLKGRVLHYGTASPGDIPGLPAE